jgi:hypothetical protein
MLAQIAAKKIVRSLVDHQPFLSKPRLTIMRLGEGTFTPRAFGSDVTQKQKKLGTLGGPGNVA